METNHACGLYSPLCSIKPQLVKILIQMAKIWQCLTPTEAIQLINSLIDGTQVQKDLVEFKKKYSHGKDGTVGYGYWRHFKKRNKHLIRSKRDAKYELNCANWSTYANFKQMYDQVYEQMEDAGAAVKLSLPRWMDRVGNDVSKEDAVGFQVTHNLKYPEMCIVMD